MEKSNLMMIVIIVLLVALLGTVVGVTFYAFNMVQSIEAQAAAAAAGWDRTPRQLHPDEIGRIMAGESILTNLAGPGGGGNMARIQVVIGYDNTQGRESNDIAELIYDQMTHIRIVALNSIGSRTAEELSAIDGRNVLAAEILDRLQNDFRTNMIVEVSFYEWVIT